MKNKIIVQEQIITIIEDDYISLTDMVRNIENGLVLIEKWLRNKKYLPVTEEIVQQIIDKNDNSILGDFGGASYYEAEDLQMHNALEHLEVRAFGCLIEDLLVLSKEDNKSEKIKNRGNNCLDSLLYFKLFL